MNSLIKILSLIVIALNSLSLAQECKANITINSDIENVNVFVDDSLFGCCKNVVAEIPEGIHKIMVVEDNYRWDAKKFIDTLNIQNCGDTTLNFKFLSDVLLNSEPGDAEVFSGDSLIGYTPLRIPLGLQSIRLQKNGYESKVINYSDLNLLKPVKLNFTGEYEDGTFFNKTLFRILLGSMITLGATTAYFKLKADNYFDDYKANGDHSLLDKTHKYDLISGVTFVALQINFGLIVYYFLVD
jgi:hypothetical protein